MLDRHSDAFREELGLIQDVMITIHVDHQVKPFFFAGLVLCFTPCTVLYTLKSRVENELDHLKNEHVIEKIPSFDWAAPIVPVVKQDGSIRLCKLTVNKVAQVEAYPLPCIEDIFA